MRKRFDPYNSRILKVILVSAVIVALLGPLVLGLSR